MRCNICSYLLLAGHFADLGPLPVAGEGPYGIPGAQNPDAGAVNGRDQPQDVKPPSSPSNNGSWPSLSLRPGQREQQPNQPPYLAPEQPLYPESQQPSQQQDSNPQQPPQLQYPDSQQPPQQQQPPAQQQQPPTQQQPQYPGFQQPDQSQQLPPTAQQNQPPANSGGVGVGGDESGGERKSGGAKGANEKSDDESADDDDESVSTSATVKGGSGELTPIKDLPKVYAHGKGQSFWLAGLKSIDYPFYCKCNQDDVEAFQQDPTWFDKDAEGNQLSKVRCANIDAQEIPYCGFMDGRASSIYSLHAAIAVSVVGAVFLLIHAGH